MDFSGPRMFHIKHSNNILKRAIKQTFKSNVGLPLTEMILEVEPTKKHWVKHFKQTEIFFLLFFTLAVGQDIIYCDKVSFSLYKRKAWCVGCFPSPVDLHNGLFESPHGCLMGGAAELNFFCCQLNFLNVGWLHTLLHVALFCAVN